VARRELVAAMCRDAFAQQLAVLDELEYVPLVADLAARLQATAPVPGGGRRVTPRLD
jgi:hypothetical protein